MSVSNNMEPWLVEFFMRITAEIYIYIYIGYRVMLANFRKSILPLAPLGFFLRVLNLFCPVKGVNNSKPFFSKKYDPKFCLGPSRAGPRVAKSWNTSLPIPKVRSVKSYQTLALIWGFLTSEGFLYFRVQFSSVGMRIISGHILD